MSQRDDTGASEILRRIAELPTDEQALVYDELQQQQLGRMTEGFAELLDSLPPPEQLLEDLSTDRKPTTLGETQSTLFQALDSRIEACGNLKEHLSAAGNPVSKDWRREWRERVKADRDSEKYLAVCLKLYGAILKSESR